jgi:hypothetical protein
MGKTWCRNKLLGIGALLLLAVSPIFAADNSPDTTAKFLAGLAVPAGSVDGPNNETPWRIHSNELDRDWNRTEQQVSSIADWAPEFLGDAYQSNGPMFYMFSGPDLLYARAFFPNASTYILCGTEPVGAVPDLTGIPPDALPAALANLRKSLESVLNWSFFITKNMKTDLTRPPLNGTLPILYVFLARSGCTLDSVTPVTVDRNGTLSEGDGEEGDTHGGRIVFTNAAGSAQTVYYFSSDLSDDGIKAHPGFLRFCQEQGRGVTLLKAASYLMHETGFSQVREFLLDRSNLILQDDSGIPLRFLTGQEWDIRYCGHYVGPIDAFKQHWQPDLANEYAHSASAPLPFGFGYQWRPNRSDLIIAERAGNEISNSD